MSTDINVDKSATGLSWQDKAQPVGTSSDQPPIAFQRFAPRSPSLRGRRVGVTDRIGVFPERGEVIFSTTIAARSQESHWSFRRLCVLSKEGNGVASPRCHAHTRSTSSDLRCTSPCFVLSCAAPGDFLSRRLHCELLISFGAMTPKESTNSEWPM